MKTLKRITVTLIAVCMLMSIMPAALATDSREVFSSVTDIDVNGRNISLQAYEINGYNYYKLRDIASMLSKTSAQFDVSWNEENDCVNITTGIAYTPVGGECSAGYVGLSAQTALTSSRMQLNGEPLTLNAYIINNNNYFKLRDLLRILNVSVVWDNDLQKIFIDTSLPYQSTWPISDANTPLTTEQIAAMAESVVMLQLYDEDGVAISLASGFFITADGWLATCYHTIENSYRAEILCDDGTVYPITSVISYNAEYDTAIVKVDADREFTPFAISYSGSLVRGQRVMSIGNPQGEQNTISDGLVSSLSRSSKGLRCEDAFDIQISVPISKGSSGGPLIDMYGNVVGIIYAMHNYGQNMNYAIPTEEFLLLFDHMCPIDFSEFYELSRVKSASHEADIIDGGDETSFIY